MQGAITLVLCAAAALLEGFDTQSMGVAAPRLMPALGLSSTQAGLVFTATTLGLFVGAALGGRVADYIGRRRALIGSLLLFGCFSWLTLAATGFTSLFVARWFTGLGLGGAMPNFITLASEAAQAGRRLRAGALVASLLPVGGALAGLVALGEGLGWSWHAIFYVGGVAPIALALIMLRFLPESTGFGPASRGASHAVAPQHLAGVGTVLFGAGRARTTVLLWISIFFAQLLLLLMLNWLPSLLVGLGFNRAEASWASVCFNLAGALGGALLGRLHSGSHQRATVVTTYSCIATALVVVASVNGSLAIALAACALAGAFIVGATLILFATAPLYYDSSGRATGVGVAIAIGRLGSVFGPLFAAILLARGNGSVGVLLGMEPFVVIGGLAAWALARRPTAR
jgi:MFS transporter, AAHS family, 3-hydroxyphenylpropionic acid transporter